MGFPEEGRLRAAYEAVRLAENLLGEEIRLRIEAEAARLAP